MSFRRLSGLLVRPLFLIAGLTACQPSGASFDYWVLALSWSPEYCASDDARPDSQQCRKQHDFVVHGLWPQFEQGYPEFCDPDSRIDGAIADRLQPLIPDRGLVFHQWRKHGTCSGLSPEAYFDTLEAAAGAVKVPMRAIRGAQIKPSSRQELEQEFIDLNPGLSADAITFHCKRSRLREVRICLDHSLKPRSCGSDLREACGRNLSVRPNR